MDCTFIIIIYLVLLVIIFLILRIVVKATIWSCIVGAFFYSLLIILLIQAIIPATFHDNRFSVQGILIIFWITVVLITIYITERIANDIDECAVLITDRNVIFN